ncbi:hypothetical protein BGZ73_008046 [Actinomortierella ambigua]|nr:hypothetical protein BGZ73_008046 [Actinomortierella ambigua]
MVNILWTERLRHAFEEYVRVAKNANSPFHDANILSQVEAALRERSLAAHAYKAQTTPSVASSSADTQPSTQPTPPPPSVDLELIRKVSATLLAYEKKTVGEREPGSGPSEYWIHSLLKGSAVYVPPPPAKEKASHSPELERILNEARAQIAAKDYNRMVDSISGSSGTGLREQMAELRGLKSTLISIVNILYTGVAVFIAVYMLSKHVFEDVGMRFLLGFLGFTMIVASESYLYYRHVTGDERAPSRKTKRSPSQSAQGAPSYDAIKNSLHDDVMKAFASSSSSTSRLLSATADEKVVPLESPATTTTTSAETSTTTATTTKRRSKKA